MTKNNHIYFILQFDPLKHSINNSSCNLTYTPRIFSPKFVVFANLMQKNQQNRKMVATVKKQGDNDKNDNEEEHEEGYTKTRSFRR